MQNTKNYPLDSNTTFLLPPRSCACYTPHLCSYASALSLMITVFMLHVPHQAAQKIIFTLPAANTPSSSHHQLDTAQAMQP